jgi:diadenosine tetraphosphate (Ap4A) HIT family hydrolase
MAADEAVSWSLHPRLAADTVTVIDLPLCRVLAMRDANYPWLILVPRRPDVSEIIDLAADAQARLMEEIAQASVALKAVTDCHKLNVAALGNAVAQLHVHVMARRRDDPAWPGPVWGAAPPRPYADGELERFVAAMRQALPASP